MTKCNVCGKEFELTKDKHYIARGLSRVGLNALSGGEEPKLYDAFDCPFCGCQMIMQERKREFKESDNMEEKEDE